MPIIMKMMILAMTLALALPVANDLEESDHIHSAACLPGLILTKF